MGAAHPQARQSSRCRSLALADRNPSGGFFSVKRPALTRLGSQREAAPDPLHLTDVAAREIRAGEIWRPSAVRTFFEFPTV
jgi:hypothetical protein